MSLIGRVGVGAAPTRLPLPCAPPNLYMLDERNAPMSKNKKSRKGVSGNPAKRLPATRDHKPKATTADATDSVQTVTLDGITFTIDLAPVANVRLMRRIRRDDLDATMEWIEAVFGDDLDRLEEAFNLHTITDYMRLFERAAEEINPNS